VWEETDKCPSFPAGKTDCGFWLPQFRELIPSCGQKSNIVILSAAKNLKIRDSSLCFASFRMTDQYYFYDGNSVLGAMTKTSFNLQVQGLKIEG